LRVIASRVDVDQGGKKPDGLILLLLKEAEHSDFGFGKWRDLRDFRVRGQRIDVTLRQAQLKRLPARKRSGIQRGWISK